MTNSKDILPEFRDQLEVEIEDTFIWAFEREPSALPLYKPYTLFRLHFTPEWNVQHSPADFFNETAVDVWTGILKLKKLRF